MSRKLVPAFLIALVLVAFFVAPALAGKTYRAERFDVRLDLLPGGDMLVTETVVFRFEGGPFTYAFRHVSANRTDGLTFLAASMDGVSMPQGTGAGQVEVEPGNPLKVTWHFAPTSDSTHVFVVRYRVSGVVSTGEADTLRWYVIPPDHSYPIAQTTIWLNYPAEVQPLEAPSLDRPYHSTPTGRGVRLVTTGIAEDTGVILTARFPAHSLATTAPAWQTHERDTTAALLRTLPVGLFSALATLLLGGLGIFAYILANRRELNLSQMTLLPTPPDDRLPPAVVGKLVGQESYSALGALFDLAQRGVLQIREEKSRWGTKYLIELINRTEPLPPHDQGMLQAIFKPGETRVDLSQILIRLSLHKKRLYEPLEQELLRRGWLDPQRKRKRTVLMTTGLLAMVVGLILFIVGVFALAVFLTTNQILARMAAIITGFGGGVFMLSSPFRIYASKFSLLTSAGEEQKMHWKSFRAYLNRVSSGREPAIRPDAFERYLAFAAVFGLGEAWARYFQKMKGVSLPSWFHSLSGAFDSMVDFISSTDTSSSSSGGNGGGASGGGSSGAG